MSDRFAERLEDFPCVVEADGSSCDSGPNGVLSNEADLSN